MALKSPSFKVPKILFLNSIFLLPDLILTEKIVLLWPESDRIHAKVRFREDNFLNRGTMKKQPFFFFFSLAAFLAVFSGCMKKQSFPDTPEISLLGFELLYDHSLVVRTGILSISYQDGNGDIGLNRGDTFEVDGNQ